MKTNTFSVTFKDNWVNNYIYHMINQRSMLMALNVSSIFKFNFDCIQALFYKSKKNIYRVYIVKK